MNRSNTSQSLSKSASRFKRRSVRQSTTRSRSLQLSNKIKIVVVKYCCQLSNKMKMIVAKYCYRLSSKLEIMQLPARTTCATQCTTTSAKQSTTPYRCKTDHRNQIFAKKLFSKNFISQTYFARILSCKPILQEEKCESKYDTKCETQYATEYEEVKRILFYIQCFPDLLLIPRFVVPRQGQSSRPSTTTSEL